MRVAVVGSGVAGLGAAWLVSREHDVTIFEKRERLGGHTHTIDVEHDGRSLRLDTGFLVYNEPTYPNLTRAFDELGVETQTSDMSLSVSMRGSEQFEWSGSGRGMLGSVGKLVDPRRWNLIRGIRAFNAAAEDWLATGDIADAAMTLDDFARTYDLPDIVMRAYVRPMVGAIWSTGLGNVGEFPVASLLVFMRNHSLLSLANHHEWRSVVGGSDRYIEPMLAGVDDVRLSTSIESISRTADGVTITVDGTSEQFDAVVIATHADQALALLSDATPDEKDVLGAWQYTDNDVWVHTDTDLMPRDRTTWSSWNVLVDDANVDGERVSLTYLLNRLMVMPDDVPPMLVTLNPSTPPRDGTVLRQMSYRHPSYTPTSVASQARLGDLQGEQHTYFAGAYHRFGFHEDAFASGVAAASLLGVDW